MYALGDPNDPLKTQIVLKASKNITTRFLHNQPTPPWHSLYLDRALFIAPARYSSNSSSNYCRSLALKACSDVM